MRFLPLFAIATALLTLPSLAQTKYTTVVPAMWTNWEGPANCYYPFSYEKCRTQILYRSGALAKTGGTITGIEFRRDGRTYSTSTFMARSWPIQVDAYVTSVSPREMTTTFATNRGSGSPTTLFNSILNLPALLPPPPPPNINRYAQLPPWSVKVPFQSFFPFKVSQGSLLFEVICKNLGTSGSNYVLDGDVQPRALGAYVRCYRFTGCVGKQSQFIRINIDPTTWVLGGSAEVSWQTGRSSVSPPPPITSIINWIGDRRDRWGSIKLPFYLYYLGGGFCRIFANWLASQPVALNAKATWGPIPKNPALEGVVLYTQALAVAPSTNRLGILLSNNALEIIIGSDLPPMGDTQVVFRRNDLTATTGDFIVSQKSYQGPITRFTGTFN